LEEKMRSDEIAQHSFDALPKVKSEVEVATEVPPPSFLLFV
jgi:hypothetical protein